MTGRSGCKCGGCLGYFRLLFSPNGLDAVQTSRLTYSAHCAENRVQLGEVRLPWFHGESDSVKEDCHPHFLSPLDSLDVFIMIYSPCYIPDFLISHLKTVPVTSSGQKSSVHDKVDEI